MQNRDTILGVREELLLCWAGVRSAAPCRPIKLTEVTDLLAELGLSTRIERKIRYTNRLYLNNLSPEDYPINIIGLDPSQRDAVLTPNMPPGSTSWKCKTVPVGDAAILTVTIETVVQILHVSGTDLRFHLTLLSKKDLPPDAVAPGDVARIARKLEPSLEYQRMLSGIGKALSALSF